MNQQPQDAATSAERFFHRALGSAALIVAGGFIYALLQPSEFYNMLAGVGTAVGAFFTFIGIFYAAAQLRTTKKIARGEFLLHVDEIFLAHHGDAYVNLRQGGLWETRKLDNKEMSKVVLYAGLFERIKVHLDNGIVDARTVHQLYSYRIKELLRNPSIRYYILNDHRSG